ncbi:MAG: efflux RND transporter periplasmic adaptor subunit [Acidobacteriota bacterium]
MKLRGWIILVVLLALLGWGAQRLIEWRNQPPEVTFARAVRESIASVVSTNGKVEPAEYADARSESAGRVTRVLVQLRQHVEAGQMLVELDTAQLQASLEGIAAQVAKVNADLAVIDSGGRRTEQVTLQSEINTATVELAQAVKDLEAEKRMEAKQAATPAEVLRLQNKVDKIQADIRALNDRKNALVSAVDRAPLDAQLRGLDSDRKRIQLQIQQSSVRAPITGTVYQFDLKQGAYLNPGDVVASIGRLDEVHVKVFVDEPDLGRVKIGLPASITWDALPRREWTGRVDRLPTQVIAQGTRQVGEVVCVIRNPDQDLLPGTNVTVRIRAEVVDSAITIPKEAVFRENGVYGVYVLTGDHLEWKPVTQGINNVTRTEVRELKEGDAVALRSDRTYQTGIIVRPILP